MPELRHSNNCSDRAGSTVSSYSLSSYDLFQRRRTLDEYPMDHNYADVARMSARRRQEKDADKMNLISTRGESNQLKSYSRRRFETALIASGKSLPPPSPEDKRIFWDEVKPTWTHRRHHSAIEHQILSKPSVQLAKNRPGSEPPRSSLNGGSHKGTEGAFRFNHLRGNNDMYPSIKRLLQESNLEYRVVSCVPNANGDCRSYRRPSINQSEITDCYLVPKEEDYPVDVNNERGIQERTAPNVLQNTQDEEDGSEHLDSVDGSAEYIGDPRSVDATKAAHKNTQRKEEGNEEDEDDDEPSPPWRCWVDDATVSSICPDPESLEPTDDVTPASPSPPAEDPAPDVSTPPVDAPADVSASKSRLSVPGKQSRSRTSSASLHKRESATSPVPEVPVGKRKSSGRLKKKKGRKGTPEPPPVEVVELPPPPPPPPTPPVVEIVEEEPKEEEKEEELVLPSYICPSSIAKSTEVEIKLWLRKSTFSGANRTLPILF